MTLSLPFSYRGIHLSVIHGNMGLLDSLLRAAASDARLLGSVLDEQNTLFQVSPLDIPPVCVHLVGVHVLNSCPNGCQQWVIPWPVNTPLISL